MPSEKLSLQNVRNGAAVQSESDKGGGGWYLITITPQGRIIAEGGVHQEETNFKCNDGDDRVLIF